MWTELEVDSGAWVCEYSVKLFGPANAVAVRLDGDAIAVISPPDGMPETGFAELEKHGEIVALVAPHAGHTLGQATWQSRYPEARLYAPVASHAHLTKLGLRRPSPLSDIPAPAEVEFRECPGTKRGGTIMVARRGGRPVVYLDEIIGNHAALPGLLVLKLLFWITRSSPGIRINRIFTSLLCTNPQAVSRAALASLDSVAGDPVIVPAHGAPIADPTDIATVRELLESRSRKP